MGNDGGSIPKRRELLRSEGQSRKLPEWEQKEILLKLLAEKWTFDFITNEQLRVPVVSDCRGRLFNKTSVLEYLLMDSDEQKKIDGLEVIQGAITSMKDVVEVKFQVSDKPSGYATVDAGDQVRRNQTWLCPITGKEMGPEIKAVYLIPCGHAFAESAITSVTKEQKCVECDQPYKEAIPILPTDKAEILRLSERIKKLHTEGRTHSLKKLDSESKKRKREAKQAQKENERPDDAKSAKALKPS